jgi:diguanylate cyclase (GGDEF)-like protein
MAHHDALTGLPNRHLFSDRVDQAFKRAKRKNCKLGLLFVDLDKFKPINDTYGHAFGDEVLKEFARRLQSSLRATDTVARVGGDEFMILLEDLGDCNEAEEIRRKIEVALAAPMPIPDGQLTVEASIGIGVYPDHADTIIALMHFADQAMYQTKNRRPF